MRPAFAQVLACVAMLAACGDAAPPQPAKRMLELKQLMEHVIDPAADAFWLASGTIITAEGEKSRAPTSDAGWDAAVNAAATLVESANLLTLDGRARDRAQWAAFAEELGAAAEAGMKAAKAKDERAVFDTGGRIYLACRGCHMKYLLGYP